MLWIMLPAATVHSGVSVRKCLLSENLYGSASALTTQPLKPSG